MYHFVSISINTCMKILGTHQTCKANGQGKDYIKNGNVKDCKFPFIHKNKKYIGCATSEDGQGNFCATKLDSKGNMLEWARCNKFCKHDAERKFQNLKKNFHHHIDI